MKLAYLQDISLLLFMSPCQGFKVKICLHPLRVLLKG